MGWIAANWQWVAILAVLVGIYRRLGKQAGDANENTHAIARRLDGMSEALHGIHASGLPPEGLRPRPKIAATQR